MKKDAAWLLEEKYDGVESDDFLADVQRLKAGEPLEYVIGHTPFLGVQIFLDSHPLIPRTETEFWVEQAIQNITDAGIVAPKVLDLCAGSGCIGVAIAKTIPNANVDFDELNVTHHSCIRTNIRRNEIDESRVRICGGDLFEELVGQKEGYDFILSNPPYVDPEIDRVAESVKNFEPHEALYGGAGGMEIIERIIREAPNHLVPGGTLYLEHEPEQSTAIQALATQNGFEIKTEKDQYGLLRYSVLKLLI